jgi:hypothetical protein
MNGSAQSNLKGVNGGHMGQTRAVGLEITTANHQAGLDRLLASAFRLPSVRERSEIGDQKAELVIGNGRSRI